MKWLPEKTGRWSLGVICAILLAYAGMGVWASRTLSATVDEVGHLVGAWEIRFEGNYLFDRDNPPLWEHWVGMWLTRGDLEGGKVFEPDGLNFPAEVYGAERIREGGTMLLRGRLAMLCVAVGLGALVACAGWKERGPVGGVGAAVAFGLEPLMLGHGALVKNDVVFALGFFAAGWAAYRLRAGLTPGRVAGLCAGAAVCVGVKLTGLAAVVLILPVAVALSVRERRKALAVIGVMWAASYVGVWGSYSFRYAASREGRGGFDVGRQVARAREERGLRAGEEPLAWKAVEALDRWKVAPNAYAAGVLGLADSRERPSYLMGQIGRGGWGYFPVAFLVKEPLAMLGMAGIGLWLAARRRALRRWAWLWVPAAMMAGLAVVSKFNIGLRHVSGVYPFLEVGVGVVAAELWAMPRGRWVCGALAAALAAEVLPRGLEQIQFFNLMAGGPRGGLRWLSDSNLDWGQDGYRLVRWEQQHPGARVFAVLSGYGLPEGLRSERLPAGWIEDPTMVLPGATEGVLAIGATPLQGTYLPAAYQGTLRRLRESEPMEVLGGTVYLYRIPLGR